MNGVIYFNHGTKHLARLAVSLHSLRAHYAGPIVVLDTGTPEAAPIIERIGASSLVVSVHRIPLAKVDRHACYVTKAALWRHSPFKRTVFLDADTIVVQPVGTLFDIVAEHRHIVVTRFRPSWNTQKQPYRGRIERWRGVRHRTIDVPAMIDAALDYPRPAINTGVLAWRRGDPLLPAWESLTRAGWQTPFTDEYAMQLLVAEWPHTLVAEWYNASPAHHECRADQVRVWHCHGGKHCRPEAWPLWGPLYRECVARNIAGIADWTPARDTRLAETLRREAAS